MRRLGLRISVFIVMYLFLGYLWRWLYHHRSPAWNNFPEDLLRATTVAVAYFLTDWLIDRYTAGKRKA